MEVDVWFRYCLVCYEFFQSGDHSGHSTKLKSFFPSLFQPATGNRINEPLNGLLVKSVLDLAAENYSLRKRLDASTVILHPKDDGLATEIKRTILL